MALVTTEVGNFTLLTGTPIEVITALAANTVVKDKVYAMGYDGTAFFAVY